MSDTTGEGQLFHTRGARNFLGIYVGATVAFIMVLCVALVLGR